MNKSIIAIILLCLISLNAYARNTQTFFAKVIDVDGHNVLHLYKDDKIFFSSFAYLNTPVRGEPYFDETNAFIKEKLLDKWHMFTIVTYGKEAIVKPSLVRLKDQTSMNAELVRQGMATVNIATKPPASLIDQAISASNEKVGMWGLDKMMDQLNRSLNYSVKSDLKHFLSEDNKTGIKPYILLKKENVALPIVCAFNTRYDEIALTVHSAKQKGFRVVESCNF